MQSTYQVWFGCMLPPHEAPYALNLHMGTVGIDISSLDEVVRRLVTAPGLGG
jgi:hypothetical protein